MWVLFALFGAIVYVHRVLEWQWLRLHLQSLCGTVCLRETLYYVVVPIVLPIGDDSPALENFVGEFFGMEPFCVQYCIDLL